MPATVIIATIMRPQGDTGVQTHFRTYEAWLRTAGRETRVVTPYDAPLAKVYPMFALRKLIHPFSGPASVRWYRHWHTVFVEEALRRCLGDGKPCVVYAQCPLSAHAALRARASPSQKVILVVHFNVSQADEWAGKSLISMDGAVAEAIRAFESDVIPRLDGLVFVSQFMRALLQARIPAIAALPYTVVLIGSDGLLSLVELRHAQNEAGKTVLDGELLAIDPTPILPNLALSKMPTTHLAMLYRAWYGLLLPLVRKAERLAEIATLRREAAKEPQLARRVELNLKIRKLCVDDDANDG